MVLYTVKYKLKGQWFWRTLKRIKGDAVNPFIGPKHVMLIHENDSSTLLPIEGTLFKFSNERHMLLLKRAENDAGQKLPTRDQ